MRASQNDITPHNINHLHRVATLIDIVQPESYVILDIDDTLITNFYTPCLLTTDHGILAYEAIISTNPLYSQLSRKRKIATNRLLQHALDKKRLVESDTGIFVKHCQEVGCAVFGLTKRMSISADATRRELLSMEMDFALSSPFPKGRRYRDEYTESLLIDGVIYTNGHEKGPILDRFLSQIIFISHLKEMNICLCFHSAVSLPVSEILDEQSLTTEDYSFASSSQVQSTITASSSSSSSTVTHAGCGFSLSTCPILDNRPFVVKTPLSPNIPNKIIFVDDLHENGRSVHTDLTVATLLCIPIYSFHYTALRDQSNESLLVYADQLRSLCAELGNDDIIMSQAKHTDKEILQYQVYHLVQTDQIVNDANARLCITRLKYQSHCEKQAKTITSHLKSDISTTDDITSATDDNQQQSITIE